MIGTASDSDEIPRSNRMENRTPLYSVVLFLALVVGIVIFTLYAAVTGPLPSSATSGRTAMSARKISAAIAQATFTQQDAGHVEAVLARLPNARWSKTGHVRLAAARSAASSASGLSVTDRVQPSASSVAAEGIDASFIPLPFPSRGTNATLSQSSLRRFTLKHVHPYSSGTVIKVRNPLSHIAIALPPMEGCGNIADPAIISRARKCKAAINAGFYDLESRSCLNAVVSDSATAAPPQFHNVYFGITSTGHAFFGHLHGFEDRLPGREWRADRVQDFAEKTAQEAVTLRKQGMELINSFDRVGGSDMELEQENALESSALTSNEEFTPTLVPTPDSLAATRLTDFQSPGNAATVTEPDEVASADPILRAPLEKYLAPVPNSVLKRDLATHASLETSAMRGVFTPFDPASPSLSPLSPAHIVRRPAWMHELSEEAEHGMRHIGVPQEKLVQVMRRDTMWHFTQLVAGAVRLVHNGEQVCTTKSCGDNEGMQIQTTATSAARFATIVAGRAAVGITAAGEVLLVTVDGKTNTNQGITLPRLAATMVELGAVEAINLGGGGSVTSMWNHAVMNSVSETKACPGGIDLTPEEENQEVNMSVEERLKTFMPIHAQTPPSAQLIDFTCTRPVSSMICVHDDLAEDIY